MNLSKLYHHSSILFIFSPLKAPQTDVNGHEAFPQYPGRVNSFVKFLLTNELGI